MLSMVVKFLRRRFGTDTSQWHDFYARKPVKLMNGLHRSGWVKRRIFKGEVLCREETQEEIERGIDEQLDQAW